MSKRELCESNESIATCYMGLFDWGVDIRYIDYDIEDTIYFIENCGSKKTYHKAKIHCTNNGRDYFYCGKRKVYLEDCLRW